MARPYEKNSSSSSSSSSLTNNLSADLHGISLTTLDNNKNRGDCHGWDPRKIRNASSRRLTRQELYDTVPREEIDAYHAKVKETKGFDLTDFPYAAVYGSICPYPIRTDEELEILSGRARSALDLYNKDSDISYEFVKLVRANWAALAGSMFFLTFEVKVKSSSAWNSSHLQTFQAKVYSEAKREMQVLFCRPEPTPPPPGSVKKRKETRLSDEDSRIYDTMFAASEGFDVPDIPNSSEVPDLYRPMKSFSTDCVIMLNKLSNLSVDVYNQENHKKCKFVKFLKANKRKTPDGDEDYKITLVVKHEDTRYQTLQAWVICDTGETPFVEFCREKPGELMMKYVPEE